MRTVDDIMKELDRLDKQYVMLNRVITKISDDDDLRKMVLDNFGISENEISELARYLAVRISRIKAKFYECEVDID